MGDIERDAVLGADPCNDGGSSDVLEMISPLLLFTGRISCSTGVDEAGAKSDFADGKGMPRPSSVAVSCITEATLRPIPGRALL